MNKTVKKLLPLCFLLVSCASMAGTIVVKNIDELNNASMQAKPGDIIIMENGQWKDVLIALSCSGTKEQPITFRARTNGKVLVTGNSRLKLGGNYLIVDGLYFTNGYAGKDAVIDFQISKNQLANNCRVTNCAVNDFNNPKRMEENYWVSFSGKNNRLDHCSFVNKKNLGVLLAVTLEDDRSRENFHSIDHNYFGRRIPLASNGGEIIRVGIAQHCMFNSNTQIIDNWFDQCDGEAEIISIKSGSNVVRNNLFQECQGNVVLRHGDNNTVENNIFLGNNKEGTGGVRVINRGQWIVNNFFYRCRGVDFRSPLSVMNGVPNSPPFRYVQVTDAVIASNTFYECSPISFCEGSDKERSLAPANVLFANNIFVNSKDSIIYKAYDDISGFSFKGNKLSREVPQATAGGFEKSLFTTQKQDNLPIPRTYTASSTMLPDSVQQVAGERLKHALAPQPGFSSLQLAINIRTNAYSATGADWFAKNPLAKTAAAAAVDCSTAESVYKALEKNGAVLINLTGRQYTFDSPLAISKKVTISSQPGAIVKINSGKLPALFAVMGNGQLALANLKADAAGVQADNFIASDANNSDHYNVAVNNCSITGLGAAGCKAFFYAHKSMVADSIVIRNSRFSDNTADFLAMKDETDDKGYYNAEKIVLEKNTFTNSKGSLLNIYRGGSDESTMGPQLFAAGNQFSNCGVEGDAAFIQLTGVQKTRFINNNFKNCYAGNKLFIYKDTVRADHLLEKNTIEASGEIKANDFVKTRNNIIR